MRPSALVLVAAALAPAAAPAQIVQFEGRVTGTMAAEGMEVEMVQTMKGSMMRLDMTLPGDAGSVTQITNVQSGEMLMILHDEKMWMDMAVMGRMIPGFSAPASASDQVELPEFRPTERIENIAGYECRHYILVIEGGEDVDVCAASGLGCFIPGSPAGLSREGSGGVPALPQSAELWLETFEDGFFVLSLEAGGASIRVHELEQGSPPDELFRPPADYEEMKIPID